MWRHLDGEEKNYGRCCKWNLHFSNPLESDLLTGITPPNELKIYRSSSLETTSVGSKNGFSINYLTISPSY